MNSNIHRAVRSNRKHMSLWQSQLGRIFPLVGFADRCPNEFEFAEAVSRWQLQQKPPLSGDGVLGPITWQRMSRILSAPVPVHLQEQSGLVRPY